MLVPSLPAYICLGMGGIHLMQRCCPDEDDQQKAPAHRAAVRDARCCQSIPAATVYAQGPPRLDSNVLPPPLVATMVELDLPVPRKSYCTVPATARGDPTSLGPPLSLRPILRI